MTAAVVIGAAVLFATPIAVFAWALCRVAALSDEAARRMHDPEPMTSSPTTRVKGAR